MSEIKNVIIHGKAQDYVPRIKTPINCVVTDPPFGVDVQMNSAVLPHSKQKNQKIENDSDPKIAIDIFNQEMYSIIPKLAPVADVYVFTSWTVLKWWIPAVEALPGLDLKMMLLWDKGYPGKGDLVANWGCGYEPILYLKKGRRPIHHRRSGIIHVDKVPAGQNIHPTEKPVQLLEILIEMSTSPGDLVIDPFSGSGSTSVAAKNLGRNSLAFEIDGKYIEPSRARLEQVGFVLS